ncbi:hypothetical protein TNCV_2233811 [Trichonephila clavipes]|nr:hypothetical protein TNCV_2233811 [Trichonephila clavipes]
MINGRTRLHVVTNGTMTGQRYIDEVLLPHVRLFRSAVDLNPIENVRDALGRQVAGRNYPPTNKNTLIRVLTEEWDKLPQQLLDNVVQSMDHDHMLVITSANTVSYEITHSEVRDPTVINLWVEREPVKYSTTVLNASSPMFGFIMVFSKRSSQAKRTILAHPESRSGTVKI